MHIDEMDATIRMLLFSDETYTKPYRVTPTIELRDKVGSDQQVQL